MQFSGIVISTVLIILACDSITCSKLEFTYAGTFIPNARTPSTSVYYVSSTVSSWGDAWFTCQQSFKGQLLAIENREEDLFIRDLMMKQNINRVWTSGAFDSTNNSWRWASSGFQLDYFNWGPAPPITNANQRIVAMNEIFTSYWLTVDASLTQFAICEVPNIYG